MNNTRSLATVIRTLLAAGFLIEGNERHPTHAEISCSRNSRFAAQIHYLISLSETDEFSSQAESDIRRSARGSGRVPVFVGSHSTDRQIGWEDFLERLGGPVPSWRALAERFSSDLEIASRNKVPAGMSGEASSLFEDLVADGFEFCLGRRVRRFGARYRGKVVSDMLGQLPDGALLIIDAKAAASGFDAGWPKLRALIEYVRTQQQRQRGHNEVFSAVVVSSSFQQPEKTLAENAKNFYSETSVPLCFVPADLIAGAVVALAKRADIRNAVRWRRIFANGLASLQSMIREIEEAAAQRVSRGEV